MGVVNEANKLHAPFSQQHETWFACAYFHSKNVLVKSSPFSVWRVGGCPSVGATLPEVQILKHGNEVFKIDLAIVDVHGSVEGSV